MAVRTPLVPDTPAAANLLQRTDLAGRARRWVLGPDVPMRVPKRVQDAITRQQDDAEILVGWVQVLAIVTFGALYSLTPKAFPPNVPFEPVPWALAFYSLFTILRLWLAYRRALTRPFLALSVVVDVAVLMVTIWSFHIQYGQPAALYVKAPTLLYVFILIALRTLRFEPWLVLLAGFSAATGWLVLVAYAIYGDPQGMMITRDYVAYMTSFKILIGAEFDKIISIAMVTLILAVAIVRARKLLLVAASERLAAAELSRFFDPEVAAQITTSETGVRPGEAVSRDAAIVMVDLRGFTRLAGQLDPNAVVRLLEEYQVRVVRAVRAHGGNIDKYLGDGILVSFGAAQPSARAAADALRAIEGLLAALDSWNRERGDAGLPPLGFGAAMAVGPVLFGAVGSEDRLEYTVIGDAVNLTAKLEKATKDERVRALTTLDAFERARAEGYESAGETPVRRQRPVAGVGTPLDLVVLAV
jgi:adenylate cyclase